MSSARSGGSPDLRWPDYRHVAEVQHLLVSLPVADSGEYTQSQRRTDFVQVFAGNSTPEQGRRVLSEISRICEGVPVGPRDVDSHALLAFRAGMRWVFGEIGNCMVERPDPQVAPSSGDPRDS